ncbi:unnamed protein product, partial [Nesidiocoris tenuis]
MDQFEKSPFCVQMNLRRSDTEPKAFHRLCSCHFLNGEKKNGPTIFPRNEAKCFRFQSPEKRRRTKKTCVAQSSDIVTPSNDILESTMPNPQPDIEEVLPCSVELPSYEYLLKSLGEANQVIARLELALEASRSEVALLKASSLTPGNVLTYDSLTTDFKLLHYFTGLPSFGSFQLLLQLLSSAPLSYYDGWKAKMPLKDQLLLTLMKLRLNSDYTDLSTRFQISRHSGVHMLLCSCQKPPLETVRAIVTSKFKLPKTKMSLEMAKYLSFCFNRFIEEAILRSGKQCMSEGSDVVTDETVQKTVTQL